MGKIRIFHFLVFLILAWHPGPAWSETAANGEDAPEASSLPAVSAEDLIAIDFKAYGGKNVSVKGGAKAFADRLVSVKRGGGATERKSIDPISALGIPDSFHENDGGHYTLGCNGQLVLSFTDNLITEQDGPELIVFEVGDATEGTLVQVSADGETWINCGTTSGGIESVEISGKVPRGSVFQFLKITDLGDKCLGTLPGADIDAVAAMIAIPRPAPKSLAQNGQSAAPEEKEPALPERMVLSGKLLFDPGKAGLKEEALAAISELAGKIASGAGHSVTVEGHTDSTGPEKTNQKLSLKRAQAVVKALINTGLIRENAIKAVGKGSSVPVGDNGTAAGRALNRRVEIVLSPLAAN